ncbi:hypothetical protein GCM10009863_56280 [Streptomyces axinellae]|uniref:Transposase n=1 Tax=Streptomyces axinellae TaxID=552788 RepID=A0ABP6D5Q3_9ACTN
MRAGFASPTRGTVRVGTSPRRTGLSRDQALGRLPDFRTLGSDHRGNRQSRPDVPEFDVIEAATRRRTTGHSHVILLDLPTGRRVPRPHSRPGHPLGHRKAGRLAARRSCLC